MRAGPRTTLTSAARAWSGGVPGTAGKPQSRRYVRGFGLPSGRTRCSWDSCSGTAVWRLDLDPFLQVVRRVLLDRPVVTDAGVVEPMPISPPGGPAQLIAPPG